MKTIFPAKLKKGDEVRVIAPARSISVISNDIISTAINKLRGELGLKVTFGRRVNNVEIFNSALIRDRVDDLNDAFLDKNVKGIISAIGGYNSNQLLDYIDWGNIRKNPKVFCGFSDLTALINAIYAMTGLVTYLGPNFATFGQKLYFDYTLKYFKRCLMDNGTLELLPSKYWLDDKWKKDQYKRYPIQNDGYLIINQGETRGTITGGNLCTLNLLHGTKYFPNLKESILFIEDDELSKDNTLVEFERNLQSLMQQPNANKINGIVVGRFQKASKVNIKDLIKIFTLRSEFANMPIIANVDFGHTDPKITFPIGGLAKIKALSGLVSLEILKY